MKNEKLRFYKENLITNLARRKIVKNFCRLEIFKVHLKFSREKHQFFFNFYLIQNSNQ